MRDYLKAIETQMELVRWMQGSHNIEYMVRVLRQFIDDDNLTDQQATSQCLVMARNLWWMVRACSPYYVTSDMTKLVQAAGTSMPAEAFEFDDLLEPFGFVFLDGVGINPAGLQIKGPFTAFSWQQVEDDESPGVNVMLYNSRDRILSAAKDGRLEEEGLNTGGMVFDWGVWGRQMPSLVPTRPLMFRLGKPLLDGYGDVGPYIKAFWAIAAQRIASTRSVAPDRPTTRRAERMQMPSTDIRVVSLRRRHQISDPGENAPVEWSHRWLVSGHWRNQYLPSRKDHRLQWIPEYIKGPENKPLVVKPTVYRVAR